MSHIKSSKHQEVYHEDIVHAQLFCWRSFSPLYFSHKPIPWTCWTFLTPEAVKEHSTMRFRRKSAAGTLSNTVFRLKPYGLYVLSATITVPAGTKLTIVAPDPGTTQETAPPMICWTPSSGVSTTFNFDCFGDIYMKNIWILYATTNTDGLGTQVGSALNIDEDTTDHVNNGVFQNVIFDYAPISNGGGAVTVSASSCPAVV